jgi:hypothetical protein
MHSYNSFYVLIDCVLSRLQLEQGEQAALLNQQSLDLVEKYNAILGSISQAFIQADAQITAAEQRAARPTQTE